MQPLRVLGYVVVGLAIVACVLLGTLGWFAVGFGLMTDCTNNYSCSETGCDPCASAERWINAGAVIQWALVGAAAVLLVRPRRAGRLVAGGLALLAMSVLTIAGTTWRAQESYCQPGTSGYAESYCSIE